MVIATGLVIDAHVHFDLASMYDANEATISQGDLFRLEGVLAATAGLVLLVLLHVGSRRVLTTTRGTIT